MRPTTSLPPELIIKALPLAAARLKARMPDLRAWREQAHTGQLPPEGEWSTWYLRGGRGGGKTWTGAHWLAEQAVGLPGTSWGIVAPTYGDARDKCVEGESGILAALGTTRAEVDSGRSILVASWNRSIGDIRLRNGTVIWVDGADDGAPTVQGQNLNGAWCSEVGVWKRTKWDMAWEESVRYAVRKDPALIFAEGTPKRGHPLVKELVRDPRVVKTVVRTWDNVDNLSRVRLEELEEKHGGTTLGRQELEGEVLDDAEGALWKRHLIRYRPAPHLTRIVIGVDPAVSNRPGSDETGIVAAGLGIDSLGYVLEDRSLNGSPSQWAREAIDLYKRRKADYIVAEANQGGDLVSLNLGTVDAGVPVYLVHASRGKQARAEPVLSLYEQGRVFHEDALPELEDQMCNWDPREEAESPDRLDAMVWAMTSLMVEGGVSSGRMSGIA